MQPSTHILTSFVFAHKRACKAVWITFNLYRPTTELLHSLKYMIDLTGRNSVGITVVFNGMGVNSRDRLRHKKHLPLLLEKGMVTVKPNYGGESVAITPLGSNVMEYYYAQFYKILSAGETKYKKKLKYGYLEELPQLVK